MHAESEPLSPIKRALITIHRLEAKIARLERGPREPIAIIGMACRFPGADSPEAFWRLLRAGRDCVREPPEGRWDEASFRRLGLSPHEPWRHRRAGYLDRVDGFDAYFFGIAPREAARMDPQHRLLLETAWEAMEDAGLPLERVAGGDAGVYVGIIGDDYQQLQLRDPAEADGYAAMGGARSAAAGRLSYFLDTHGPCVTLDSACASSLSAIHHACRALRARECSLAFAGGVNLLLSPLNTILLARLNALAPDGRCKTFDARANGYVRGEGCGVLALKRLSDAERDGDRIHAVIRGSAENQDGRSNGFTAPNGLAQAQALRLALANSGVSAEQVGLLETHGTGTALGDPIEVEAVQAVYGDGPRLALGAVKTNIGHLESAAGVAGVIKAALAIRRRQIPPNLHFQSLNPHISLENSRLFVPTQPIDWDCADLRRAGVSAFGINGCNVHLILEEYAGSQPDPDALDSGPRGLLLPVSARDPQSLRVLAQRYRDLLSGPETAAPAALRAFCRNAALRRTHHSYRLALVGSDSESLAASCDERLHTLAKPAASASGEKPPVAWVFSGQSVRLHPPPTAFLEEPVVADVLSRCEAAFRQLGKWSLLERLRAPVENSRLQEDQYAQPALFSIQVALAELWRDRGIVPEAVIGHSVGEAAAAYAAGALSLEDAAAVVFHRSRLAQAQAGKGGALFIAQSVGSTAALIESFGGKLSLAAHNGPNSTVVGGDLDALTQLEARLREQDVFCKRLTAIGYASHTHHMDPVRRLLQTYLRGLKPRAAKTPLVSTVYGRAIAGSSLTAEYWGRNLREMVRFREGIDVLLDQNVRAFLEISPHPVLGAAIRECMIERGVDGVALPSLDRRRDPQATLLDSLGVLYERGFPINWERLHSKPGRHFDLPHYPWRRERFWFNAPVDAGKAEFRDPHGQEEASGEEVLDALLRCGDEARGEAALRYVVARTAHLLRMRPDRFDPSRSLRELGMDSLIASELHNLGIQELGVDLPLARLLGGANAVELAAWVREAVEAKVRAPHEGRWQWPATERQSAAWLVDRIYGFNHPRCFLAAVRLEAEAVREAMQNLWDAAPLLDARFGLEEGALVMRAGRQQRAPFRCIACGDDQLEARLAEEGGRPFNLSGEPLFRAVMLLPTTLEPRLLLCAHPCLLDGRGLAAAASWLGSLLFGSDAPAEANLFREEACRHVLESERTYLGSSRGKADRQFWLAQARLPRSLLRIGEKSAGPKRFGSLIAQVPQAVFERIGAGPGEVPIAARLLAAYRFFLLRESGAPRLAIATSVRSSSEAPAAMIGSENLIVIDGDLSTVADFAAAAQREEAALNAALEHRDYPLGGLLREAPGIRRAGVRPWFQTAFTLCLDEGALFADCRPTAQEPGFAPMDAPRGAACDLAVAVDARDNRLTLSFTYNAASLSAEAVAALAARFQRLLAELGENPETPIDAGSLAAPSRDGPLWSETRKSDEDEPQALAAALLRCPAVRRAAVRVNEDNAVAYVAASVNVDRLQMLVKCQIAEAPGRWFLGENLSPRGLCLRRAPTKWRPGQRVGLTVFAPGEAAPIQFEARVAWARQGKAGLCFQADVEGANLLKTTMARYVERETASLGHLDYARFRLALRLPCFAEDRSGRRFELTAENLYTEGVRLLNAPRQWRPGTRIQLTFPGDDILAGEAFEARLAWRDDARAGFAFEESQSGRAALRRFFARFMEEGLLTPERLDAWLRENGVFTRVRWRLVDALPQGEPAPSVSAASRSGEPGAPLESLLRDVWRDVLRRPDLSVDDDLFLHGADSLALAFALDRIQAELGAAPTPEDVFRAATVARLAALLGERHRAERRKAAQAAMSRVSGGDAINHPWIAPLKTHARPRGRLFCFSFLGGGGSVFRPLFERFDEEIDVLGLQAPGREDRMLETPFTHFFAAIGALEKALRPFEDLPFAFFGHSMGALCCFELARELRRHGRELPARLILAGMPAPQRVADHPMLHAPPPENAVELARDWRGAQLEDERVLRLALPTLRADAETLRDYVYVEEEPLDTALTVFGGLADPIADARDLAAWSQQARADFSMEMFPGDHFFPFAQPDAFAQALARRLRPDFKALDDAIRID